MPNLIFILGSSEQLIVPLSELAELARSAAKLGCQLLSTISSQDESMLDKLNSKLRGESITVSSNESLAADPSPSILVVTSSTVCISAHCLHIIR
jgi:hypothetical protein